MGNYLLKITRQAFLSLLTTLSIVYCSLPWIYQNGGYRLTHDISDFLRLPIYCQGITWLINNSYSYRLSLCPLIF